MARAEREAIGASVGIVQNGGVDPLRVTKNSILDACADECPCSPEDVDQALYCILPLDDQIVAMLRFAIFLP